MCLIYPPEILHKHCFQFLLGIIFVPREIKDNSYANFGSKQGALWSALDRIQQMNSTVIPWRIFSYSLPKGWKTAYSRARWYCNTTHTKITKTTLEKEAQYCNTINNLVWNWKPCNCMKNLELAPWVHWEWKGWNSCGNVATTGI